MRTIPQYLLALCVAMLTPAATAESILPDKLPADNPVAACYEVSWDTPSANSHGTMPLGNGEVGVNVWVDPAGDLNFFLSRTDSLDEYGRVMKVGGGKIVFESTAIRPDEKENVPKVIAEFKQTLDTRMGLMHVYYELDDQPLHIFIRADANHPVVTIQVASADPVRAEFQSQIWRTAPGEEVVANEVADMLQPWKTVMRIRPDTILTTKETGENAVGWYHHNAETFGYDETAKTQGMDDFPRENPLLHRTFGALVTAATATHTWEGETLTESWTPATRVDDKTLRCSPGKGHSFEIAVHTAHPAAPDVWLNETREILKTWEQTPRGERYENHVAWWADFWRRSWIHISPASDISLNTNAKPASKSPAFYTAHAGPLRVGVDSNGENKFPGSISFKMYKFLRLEDGQDLISGKSDVKSLRSEAIPGSEDWDFSGGGQFELGFTTPRELSAYYRLLDKITAGGSDGFLLDITPERKLRLVLGQDTLLSEAKLEPQRRHDVKFTFRADGQVQVTLDGKRAFPPYFIPGTQSETQVLTRAYLLQRYIDACAGRGNFLAQFNGSLFTVPHPEKPGFADYRRWGTGYWWQNMRLTRYAFFMSGDHDQLRHFLEAYHRLLPICEYRAQKYFGFNNAAYYPECMYAWGDVFPETYGTVPWNERDDKLQASGWHKWEWVGGLELACMMLAYYDYTGDEAFLREKSIPLADSVTRFFDAYYKTDEATGKLIMHPSQAAETWWECTNPATEVAGLHATLGRLLALPENLTTDREREAWRTLLAKIPDIPVWTDKNGVKRLAPADKFAKKHNMENPELYPVFPFRLVSFEKPLAEEAVNALRLRWDRGAFGWRQDDIFMAYLGLSDQAADYLVQRARKKDPVSRFPAFWGPNYDWTPDQDHGGILTNGVQSLLMQTDGRKIFLLPALPAKWNADFKLHAPYGTVVEGRVENGVVTSLTVTPEERRKDVILCEPFTFSE